MGGDIFDPNGHGDGPYPRLFFIRGFPGARALVAGLATIACNRPSSMGFIASAYGALPVASNGRIHAAAAHWIQFCFCDSRWLTFFLACHGPDGGDRSLVPAIHPSLGFQIQRSCLSSTFESLPSLP